MKLLVVQNMLFLPTFGGANKSVRVLLESLATRGHECAVIAPALASHGFRETDQLWCDLVSRRVASLEMKEGAICFMYRGVRVTLVQESAATERWISKTILSMKPDALLVPCEDPGQRLLTHCVGSGHRRIKYIVQTPTRLPFGPLSSSPSKEGTDLVRSLGEVMVISEFLKDYLSKHAAIPSRVFHLPIYNEAPAKEWRDERREYITFVNPSPIKGSAIVRALIERFPKHKFALVPTWATTPEHLADFARFTNVVVIPPQDDFERILASTRVLLVPSLWQEAFGYICIEAMLWSIPVMASNVGGLPEAKLNVDYVLPVTPIVDYEPDLDSRGNRIAVVRAQNVEPWVAALKHLLEDSAHYRQIAQASATAALQFVRSLSWDAVEAHLFADPGLAACESPAPSRRNDMGKVVAET